MSEFEFSWLFECLKNLKFVCWMTSVPSNYLFHTNPLKLSTGQYLKDDSEGGV